MHSFNKPSVPNKACRLKEAELTLKLLEQRHQLLNKDIELMDKHILVLKQDYQVKEAELVEMVSHIFMTTLEECKAVQSTTQKKNMPGNAADAKSQAKEEAKQAIESNEIISKLYNHLGLSIDKSTRLMEQLSAIYDSTNLDVELEAFEANDKSFIEWRKKADDSIEHTKLLLKNAPQNANKSPELDQAERAMNSHVKNFDNFVNMVFLKKYQTTLSKIQDNLEKACSIRKQLKEIQFSAKLYPLPELKKAAEDCEKLRNDYLLVRGDDLEIFAKLGPAIPQIVAETKSRRDKVLIQLQTIYPVKNNPAKEEAKAANPVAAKKPLVPSNPLEASAAQLSAMGLLSRSNAVLTPSPTIKANVRVGMASST